MITGTDTCDVGDTPSWKRLGSGGVDDVWRKLMDRVVRLGHVRPDRTGVGTFALFGEQVVFDNRDDKWMRPGEERFPAVTVKKLAFGQVKAELAAFLSGADSLSQFHGFGCRIWDANGTAEYWKPRQRFEGDLGRIYGVQWRRWRSANFDVSVTGKLTDQLRELVDGIRKDPFGRRHLVTAWNPGELDRMCLPPCHVLFQAFLYPAPSMHDRLRLDLRVDMRSVDLFLGLPFDIASYALLQRLLCKEVDADCGWLVFQLGDAHVYRNHEEQVKEVLGREPMKEGRLILDEDASLFSFRPEQARLADYISHPPVPAPMNV